MVSKTSTACGCEITYYGDGSAPPEIDYCDLHFTAPDLLAACQAMLRNHDACFEGHEDGEAVRARYYAAHPDQERIYDKARASIALAERG